MITVIKEGNKDKQGNAICPKCGEKVLIKNQWGSPPSCPSCGISYRPDFGPQDYYG